MRRTPLSIACFLLISCSGGGESITGPDGNVPFATVHREQLSGVRVKRAEVISRADAWEQAWNEIVAQQSPKPPLPAVDFAQNILVFVAMGDTPDACRSVVIERVERRGGELQVAVKETRLPTTCACPAIVVRPVHVVSVPRAATGATFAYRAVTEGTCS